VILILLIGLLLLGLSVIIVLRAVGLTRVRSADAIESIDPYGFTGRTETVLLRGRGGGQARAAVDDLLTRLGDVVFSRFRSVSNDQVRSELVAAGIYGLTARKFTGYRVIAAVVTPLVFGWLLTTSGLPLVLVVLAAIGSVAAGWMIPLILVRERAKRRHAQIDYQLPELIDLLVVTVEAGVGFTGSLRIAGERVGGPLGEELRLALQEQNMGLTRNEALLKMLARADTTGMRSFVRSILQGETLGVSMGLILRNLAQEMRKRRRANAEERAQKAPVKVLFPLVFMIFPAMFVILLGPALYAFLDAVKQ
jgi:tight adherence protein C